MLLLAIGWHCCTKQSLKMLASPLKLELRLLLTNNGGIIGVFLPLTKVEIHYGPISFARSVLTEVFSFEYLIMFISSAPALCNLTRFMANLPLAI